MNTGLFPILCSFEESSDDKYCNPIEVMGNTNPRRIRTT